jgi:hypothetical protein
MIDALNLCQQVMDVEPVRVTMLGEHLRVYRFPAMEGERRFSSKFPHFPHTKEIMFFRISR